MSEKTLASPYVSHTNQLDQHSDIVDDLESDFYIPKPHELTWHHNGQAGSGSGSNGFIPSHMQRLASNSVKLQRKANSRTSSPNTTTGSIHQQQQQQQQHKFVPALSPTDNGITTHNKHALEAIGLTHMNTAPTPLVPLRIRFKDSLLSDRHGIHGSTGRIPDAVENGWVGRDKERFTRTPEIAPLLHFDCDSKHTLAHKNNCLAV